MERRKSLRKSQCPRARPNLRGRFRSPKAPLSATSLRRPVESADHQAEAADIAARVGGGTNFGHQAFGLANYGFWRVHLAVGRGEGAKVRELACGVDPTAVKSADLLIEWLGWKGRR